MTQSIYPVGIFKTRMQKEERLKQRGMVIWLTGLSSSGKTTLACKLEELLFESGFFTQVLDGDNLRSGLNANLSFSADDRKENVRRVAETAKLFAHAGVITICCLISPTNDLRAMAKDIIGQEDYFEVYANAPLEVCEKRDVKGLYKKARAGEIPNFTGIDAPFEIPVSSDVVAQTSEHTPSEIVAVILEKILPKIKQS